MKLFIQLMILSLSVSMASAQSAGSLDSTFNGTGIYTHDFGFQDNFNDVTIQPDQKIICTGVALTPSFTGELKVMRLNTDGTPDNSFANNGVFSFLQTNETYGYESFVRSDGKIVIAGIASLTFGYYDMLLIRLNSDGTIDTTFGNQGYTVTDFEPRDDFAYAVAEQPDGKIVVAGTITDTTNFYNLPTIVRFTENGFVDSTFGTNGITQIPGLYIDNELTSIAVQNDGKIIAAGHYSNVFTGSDDFDVLLMRVDSNGVLDNNFGTNGVVRTAINGGVDDAFGMELDTAGNIVVGGFTTLPFTLTLDMILLKYDNSGTLDPNFGTGGIVTFNNSDEDVAYDLKIQPDNKIVVGGGSGLSFFGPRDIAIWRYLPNGNPDNTFGTNGFVTTTVFSNFQDANGLGLQTDGKIVIAGKGNNTSNNDVIVARYYGDVTSSLDEITNSSTMELFPNPVSKGNDVTLIFSGVVVENYSIELSDLTGKIIPVKYYSSNQNNSINISLPKSLNGGVYFLKFRNDKNTIIKKVVVE